ADHVRDRLSTTLGGLAANRQVAARKNRIQEGYYLSPFGERTYASGTHLPRHTAGLAGTLSRFPSNLAEDFGAVVSRYALRRCLVQRSLSRGRRSGTLVR